MEVPDAQVVSAEPRSLFSSRRRHTTSKRDWSSDVCSSDLSILLTSNRDRAEWPDLFGEPLLASAALDRLTHGAHFVEITGQSFRAEHTKKQLTARQIGRASRRERVSGGQAHR